jgi:hypothetical protein
VTRVVFGGDVEDSMAMTGRQGVWNSCFLQCYCWFKGSGYSLGIDMRILEV